MLGVLAAESTELDRWKHPTKIVPAGSIGEALPDLFQSVLDFSRQHPDLFLLGRLLLHHFFDKVEAVAPGTVVEVVFLDHLVGKLHLLLIEFPLGHQPNPVTPGVAVLAVNFIQHPVEAPQLGLIVLVHLSKESLLLPNLKRFRFASEARIDEPPLVLHPNFLVVEDVHFFGVPCVVVALVLPNQLFTQ